MAFVMGISSAQASLLDVHEDFIDSSGVYAIIEFTSFHIFCHTGFWKNQRGGCGRYNCWDELSVLISHRCTGGDIFQGIFGYDNDGRNDGLARVEKISGAGVKISRP